MNGLKEDEIPVLIDKREIAQIQLVEAINLFLSQNYIPCITLAGAAEEIFARFLNQANRPSIVEISISEIEKIREKTNFNVLAGKPKKEIFNLWNAAKNSLKHHDKKGEEVVLLHPFNDAYMMVRRALFNARELKIIIANSQDFENWIISNKNM